jgi:type IV secretion system protein VirB10
MGQTKRVEGFGQTRLAVVFHRLIMPDGYSVDLDQFQGLNQIGETGLKDKVNHHYLQIFGASIAVGAIGGLAEIGTNTTSLGLAETPADAYRQGVATSLSQSSMHILDRFLNLLPTITIREGHRVKVYFMQDLLVPDYAQHEMPSDI